MKKITFIFLAFTLIVLSSCQEQQKQQVPVQVPAQVPVETSVPDGKTTQQATNFEIALVALEDNGQAGDMIGCGDSLVLVNQPLQPGDDQTEAAINYLLGINQEFYGQSGLYDALWQSNLQLTQTTQQGNTLNVQLSGTTTLSGTCDVPRFKEQLKKTIEQNSGLTADIYINGQTIDNALSQQ